MKHIVSVAAMNVVQSPCNFYRVSDPRKIFLEEVRGKLFYGLHLEFYLIRLKLIIWVKVVGVWRFCIAQDFPLDAVKTPLLSHSPKSTLCFKKQNKTAIYLCL